MLRLAEGTRVYVALSAVDFRKAIDGLAALVVEQFSGSPGDGSVYVFYNRNADRVKCLFWDKNGFVLYQKRMERGRFKLKERFDGSMNITPQQLDWLLAGLDFRRMAEFPGLDFTNYF
jgi:transposase